MPDLGHHPLAHQHATPRCPRLPFRHAAPAQRRIDEKPLAGDSVAGPTRIVVEQVRGRGMIGTEVCSTHGDSHRGHVSPDGLQDRGGLRYRINSASLRFVHRTESRAEGDGEYLDQVEGV